MQRTGKDRRSLLWENSVPLNRRLTPLILLTALSTLSVAAMANWPQAGGPELNWRLASGKAPVKWSVARNEGIRWKTPLPNGGQGGVTVWKDRLFLTAFEEYQEGTPRFSSAIRGYCLDAENGRILWSVPLKGEFPSPILYAYSDSTSWTPVTDGKHVWFFNASGEMGCWDFQGREVWRRQFLAPGNPFNKQHEPILFGNDVITLEPLAPGEPGYSAERAAWHYLRGVDKATGKTRWIAEDATTYYCTTGFGRLPDGTPALLHGRGGPHDVPERPIGLSMTSLAPGKEGKTIWRYTPEDLPGGPVDGTTFQALYTMTWDQKYAYWFRNAPEESHLVLDAATGKLVRSQSLIRNVVYRPWDPTAKQHRLQAGVNIREVKDPSSRVALKPGEVLHVFPNWHANLVVDGHHYFFTSTGHRRNSHAPKGQSGPSHCIGRVNVETGKVEYLEVPVGVERVAGQPDRFLYGQALRTKTLDNKGRDVAAEDRSRTDGWQIPAFFGSPIAVGHRLYLGTMLGVTYVIDTRAKVLDEKALLAVNDLGPLGDTWSLNSLSFSDGKLYHRSLREVVCIER